jgi:hypothetical protein
VETELGLSKLQGRDLHTALKTSVLRKTHVGALEVVLAELQWGKSEKGYGLHVSPSSFTTSGFQTTDFLAYLGFQRHDRCPFTAMQRCFSQWATTDFDLDRFVKAFNDGFVRMQNAQRALEMCGFTIPQPQGHGFFYGKPGGSSFTRAAFPGDGHTALKSSTMKSAEDARFEFKFTFVDTAHGKAFVTHYRPKHLPISSEISGVFKLLGLRKFESCPEFDFEECYFRPQKFEQDPNDFWERNTEYAHRAFDATAIQFSIGIENLLEANAVIETTGMRLLPLAQPADRMRADIATSVRKPDSSRRSTRTASAALPETFDVAISFAGTERNQAHELADLVRSAGFAVFYDDFYPEQLWGKNLAIFFDEIFRRRARFCVMFVSGEYEARKWTIHEARSAQARALEEKGNEYILPIQVDGTKLTGLLPTIGYVPISTGLEEIARLLIKKLRQ